MFRFSMRVDDAAQHITKAKQYGIVVDDKFTSRRWEEFFGNYPGFIPGIPGQVHTDVDDEYDALTSEIEFRWDEITPASFDMAVKLVRAVFLNSPVRVWLDGEEHRLSDYLR